MAEDEWVYVSKEEWDAQKGSYELLCIIVPEYHDLTTINAKLQELVNGYADLFEREAATNNGRGPYYSGEDWLALANDMRIELAKCCGELGIEVE